MSIIISLLKRLFCSAGQPQPQEHIAPEKPKKPKKPKRLCPLCGWQYAADQKVCRNSRCRVRF